MSSIKQFLDGVHALPAAQIPEELEKRKLVQEAARVEQKKDRKHGRDGREALAREIASTVLVFGPLGLTALVGLALMLEELGVVHLPHADLLLGNVKALSIYSLANMQAFVGAKLDKKA